jgi:hypothetical protein
MVQYYNLKGCPFVILIDKQGKIIHVQFTDGPSENIIIAKIKSALTQNPEQTHLK